MPSPDLYSLRIELPVSASRSPTSIVHAAQEALNDGDPSLSLTVQQLGRNGRRWRLYNDGLGWVAERVG